MLHMLLFVMNHIVLLDLDIISLDTLHEYFI